MKEINLRLDPPATKYAYPTVHLLKNYQYDIIIHILDSRYHSTLVKDYYFTNYNLTRNSEKENVTITIHNPLEGVYPQSDVSLAIVDIDASKGFVDLWVHLSFAISAIFDVKQELKLLEMACDQVQTCLIFPLRWACFPIQIGRNAQWEHLFSMYFDDFLTIYFIFCI